jgi:hypothetical protein
MTRLTAGLAAAFVLACAAPAAAQPLPDPEAVLVEELIVRAKEPGPAWWRVKDADTTVWILAVGDDRLPAGVSWDDGYVRRRIQGANELIVGNRISLKGGLKDIPKLLKARSALKSKTPLEAGLPPELRDRFVAQRQRIGQPAKRYAGWKPLLAGEMLTQDALGEAPSVTRNIEALARKAKVKVFAPASYDAIPFIQGALKSLTPAVHQRCLEGALDDLEAPPEQGATAARAWAQGDVAGALRGPRSFDKCMLLLGGGEQLWRRATDDTAGAIAHALKTPGHAVAIVSLRRLLAEDGVGARLEARGLEVLTSADP